MTTIKLLKREAYNDNYTDERILSKRKKYASDKKRTIALRIANNKKTLDASFVMKDKRLSFNCIRFNVSNVEQLSVNIDKDTTQRIINAKLREEVTALINKDIAVVLDVHDIKTAIRETCTLRHSICYALYHMTHNKKFFDFAQDRSQTDSEAKSTKKSSKSQVANIAKIKTAKQVKTAKK